MILSDAGLIAQSVWQDIPNHFAFILLDKFVIMPDHIHGILILGRGAIDHNPAKDQMRQNGGITGIKNPMLHDNISRVIRWYKGRCTFEIRKFIPEFEWQRRFHDRIVRNDTEWDRIRKYIEENPEKWNDDKLEL